MAKLSRRLLLAGLAAPVVSRAARAAGVEIHVLSSGSFTAAYQRLAPEFERRTGHRLVSAFGASFGPAPDALPQRLGRGEPADVVLALEDALEALAGAGHLDAGSVTRLAETRVAFAVRAGTPKPDMSTVDAMRAALLAAPSIAYSPSGSGRFYETELVQRLGIAEQVMPKSRRWFPDRIGAVVARGDAAMGLQQISELLPIPGIEVIRIPEEVQKVSFASAALGRRAQQPEAARQLMTFLSSPEAAPMIAATGLDPIRR
ncbi:substrate-binding domain-containing protein [Pseudoroseomonas ludipueritiae]|uniref:Substrate-binding domain-containing protein n=1 Tax=Pseudoroseomonas ludipueritiae TaxID=198093 RepID=A0ABR7RB38_9PROT|nr:substrate-binding domain-containing protein [Pseudoroseomonas ludipueritiae]MBC9179047.1 substrate-binding domain-containing protein [Pseudoroseomonas ludipueritiae]